MTETQTTTSQQATEQIAYTLDRPVAFDGTREQAAANYETHQWFFYDEGAECDTCATRAYHEAANYPCGQEPPRETVVVYVR